MRVLIHDAHRQSPHSPLRALFVIPWGGVSSPSARRSGSLLASLAALCLCVTAAHADSAQSASTWPAHNRYLAIHLGQQQQNYRELDTQGLTGNGILNTETGNQQHLGAAISYQTTSGWLFGLDAQRQTGATAYSGYLQAGNGSLSPYAASTGNVSTQYSVQIGYGLNASTWSAMPSTWQVTPLLQLAQHQWQRNLAQYSEDYRHTSTAGGLRAQWQMQPGTVLEAQALLGRTQSATVSVPAFGFETTQNGGSYQQWHLGITQDLGAATGHALLNGWAIAARYAASQYSHGASDMVNGLQAPPSEHKPSVWTLGLQNQF
jgi:opacity protein-like surface antigen